VPDLLKKISLLEHELARLTEERRFAMTTLEMAASLLTFESGPNEQTEQEQTLSETASKILSLLSFAGLCFYLINEDDASFSPAYCEPAEYQPEFEIIVDQLIEDQTFAWALGRNKAVRVEINNPPRTLLLHSITTTSRTRGMFIGIPMTVDDDFESPLPLLTLILHSCANILESYELYHRMRQFNRKLELNVAELKQRSEELQLSREASRNACREKNILIASLEKQALKLTQEINALFNTRLNDDQAECADKLKTLISQILSEVTTSPEQ